MTDDELLAALREALASAEVEQSRVALRVERCRAAIEAFGGGHLPEPVTVPARRATAPTRRATAPTGRVVARPKPASKGRRAGVDLERVARVARAAFTTRLAAGEGQSMRQAVADELGIRVEYAGQLINLARRGGHDLPYDRVPTGTRVDPMPKPAVAKPPPVASGLGSIERTPIDHQAVRDAQAGPPVQVGPTGFPGPPKGRTPRPATPTVGDAWTPQRALAVLEGDAS